MRNEVFVLQRSGEPTWTIDPWSYCRHVPWPFIRRAYRENDVQGYLKNSRDEKCLAQQAPVGLTHLEARARQKTAYAVRKEIAAGQRSSRMLLRRYCIQFSRRRCHLSFLHEMAAAAREWNTIAKLSLWGKSTVASYIWNRIVMSLVYRPSVIISYDKQ